MTLRIAQGPRFATSDALTRGNGVGPYKVVGGVLAWDSRFDAVPQNMIPLRRGGYARVGSVTAALEVYRLAVDMRAEINRLEQHLGAALGPRWQFGDPVPAGADELLTVAINAEIQWGTLLRVLGALYYSAEIQTSVRPFMAAIAGIDLQRIRFLGRPDPISRGREVWIEVSRPAGWAALGASIIAQWSAAYPERARLPLAGAEALASDLERQTAAIDQTMGFALPWFAWVVVIIVGIGATAYLVNRTLGGAAMFAGVNLDYMTELNRELADAYRRCSEGEQSACTRWREIAARIESVNPPIAGLGRLALLGGMVVGAYWLWRHST